MRTKRTTWAAAALTVGLLVSGCTNSFDSYFSDGNQTEERPPRMDYMQAIQGAEHTLWNVRHALSQQHPNWQWEPTHISADSSTSQLGGGGCPMPGTDQTGTTSGTFLYSVSAPTAEWDWQQVWATIEHELTQAGFANLQKVRDGETRFHTYRMFRPGGGRFSVTAQVLKDEPERTSLGMQISNGCLPRPPEFSFEKRNKELVANKKLVGITNKNPWQPYPPDSLPSPQDE